MEKLEIDGKVYSTVAHHELKDKEGNVIALVPEIDIPVMSDYVWHVTCLESRLKSPELYQGNENIRETKENLKRTILKYGVPKEHEELFGKYPLCYEFIGLKECER